MPLSLAQKYRARNSFATMFKQTGYDENCEFPDEESKFKSIISVQGFGYSGSGALIDFFREYPKFAVLGYVDVKGEGGGYTPKSMQLSEIDFIRLSGGLFEIEKYIGSRNNFFNDALLNRTVQLFGSSSLYRCNSHIRDLMFRFFAKIAYLRLENLSQPYYNSYTVGLNETPDLYFLKQMPREEYIQLCRRFLNSVFNEFCSTGKEFMVGDQLLSDGDYDVKRNKEYIPNLKMIMVTRDPRDTYAWAIKRNVEWMEHQSVETFIEWYKNVYSYVNPSNNTLDCLVVRYEDLIFDYDNQEKIINNYLGVSSQDHELRQQYFRPDYSKRYVGIYKEMPDREEEFALIRETLPDYCYSMID
jgi:hypothetical protein